MGGLDTPCAGGDLVGCVTVLATCAVETWSVTQMRVSTADDEVGWRGWRYTAVMRITLSHPCRCGGISPPSLGAGARVERWEVQAAMRLELLDPQCGGG